VTYSLLKGIRSADSYAKSLLPPRPFDESAWLILTDKFPPPTLRLFRRRLVDLCFDKVPGFPGKLSRYSTIWGCSQYLPTVCFNIMLWSTVGLFLGVNSPNYDDRAFKFPESQLGRITSVTTAFDVEIQLIGPLMFSSPVIQ
jgi:hypothetical protein